MIALSGVLAIGVELARVDCASLGVWVGLGMVLATAPIFVIQIARYSGRLAGKLERSRALYQSLVEHSEDGIILYREDRILFANPAAAALVGLSVDQLQARALSELVPPEYIEGIRERHAKRLRGEPTPSHYEVEILHSDGHHIPAELAPTVVPYRGGRASQTVIRDLSNRRELEARLLHSTRIAAIGELASGVAHQLNNPMIGILNMAEVLSEQVADEDPRKKLVGHIIAAGNDASTIIRNLLKFSRTPSEGFEMVSLSRLVREVLTISEKRMLHHDVAVAVRIAEDGDAWIRGNENMLAQVLLNLLQNAQHAIGDHGQVTINVEPFYEDDERLAALRVRDDGPGIPAEVLPRVFDPFFTTKDRDQGTGLGLSLARQIVFQHGGRIWARNHPEGGAEFTVVLPLYVREAGPAEAGLETRAFATSGIGGGRL